MRFLPRRTPTRLFPATVLIASAACFGGPPTTGGGLSTERRAALATVNVENRTDLHLTIAFRYATEPGGEVVIGAVPAGEVTEMAPVPAGEPITLLARGDGFEQRLAPRSLEIDQVWTWIIRPDSATHEP